MVVFFVFAVVAGAVVLTEEGSVNGGSLPEISVAHPHIKSAAASAAARINGLVFIKFAALD